MSSSGEFKRDASYIPDRITRDARRPEHGPVDGELWPVEPGRYRLVAARACPWATRAIIERQLLGLEDVISLGTPGPTHDERSWTFDLDPGGVDRAGFAGSQEAYDAAYDRLWVALDWLEERLSTRRYLMGEAITEADVRLWTTLARFDAVYHGHFKCNRQKLTEMPALWGYARDLFQTPGFGDTTDFVQIKQHYYIVHEDINPTGVVPKGPELGNWLSAHGREALGGRPFGDGTPPGPVRAGEEVAAGHGAG